MPSPAARCVLCCMCEVDLEVVILLHCYNTVHTLPWSVWTNEQVWRWWCCHGVLNTFLTAWYFPYIKLVAVQWGLFCLLSEVSVKIEIFAFIKWNSDVQIFHRIVTSDGRFLLMWNIWHLDIWLEDRRIEIQTVRFLCSLCSPLVSYHKSGVANVASASAGSQQVLSCLKLWMYQII